MLLVLLIAISGSLAAEESAVPPPDVLLITLDTTRADALGVSGNDHAHTPVLDRLAALGVTYPTAITPAPLTLPAHATILTGIDPPEHGVRSNGGEALPESVPTIATALADRGWATAAFLGSRILDHRFGLAAGFDHYDDVMPAERIGEYGYPERDARAVTDAAIDWLGLHDGSRPFFAWVHYYDPHAPYLPHEGLGGGAGRAAYLGEVTFVDEQIGRLLHSLPRGLKNTVVVVVGDHGESLGEHGERTHGLFLYRATLEVPLIVVAPSLAAGTVIDHPVPLRQVAPTLLELAGIEAHPIADHPGLPVKIRESASPGPIFAEATMPRWVFGWAPLRMVISNGLKYIDAPHPELFDLAGDPGETNNLIESRPDEATRLARLLDEMADVWGEELTAAPPDIDAETRAALRSLGYIEGDTQTAGDAIDPKDGIAILAELDSATRLLRTGHADEAVELLAALVRRNPGNATLQTRYGEALLAAGENEHAIAAYRVATDLRPRSDFAWRNLGEALLKLQRAEEAKAAFAKALEIDPRTAPVWLRLVDLADDDQRTSVLRQAAAAGTASITVFLSLAEAELGPDPTAALDACTRAGELAPVSAEVALCLGRAHLALGEPFKATPHLRRATVLGRGTPTAEKAAELLALSTAADPR